MKRNFICIHIFILISAALAADINTVLKEIDSLHYQYKHPEIIQLIESSIDLAQKKQQKADLYWRLARATLYTGDIARANGQVKDEVLAIIKQAEALADHAIVVDPDNPAAYYWKSVCIGNWGAEKGMLDSLAGAKPMKKSLEDAIDNDPRYAEAYWVLGMLYDALPGAPFSFGNKKYAVSLGRQAVDLHLQAVKAGIETRINYGIYKELAGQLYSRDWTAKKRQAQHKKIQSKFMAASDVQKKKLYYEGTIVIPDKSDRQEALELAAWIVSELESLSDRTFYDNEDLAETRELLAEWRQ